jgi:class 3 adenylate cyclase
MRADPVAPRDFQRHSAAMDHCPGPAFSMKRKIAAIFAADIAGNSRLVAEDEEETLRRLASYRQVTDDFIAKSVGRIFNTAGDAVLAEFPSAVEAVRCAIDIQESLRTRNMAYPPSRHMSFRSGITIGDVVEREWRPARRRRQHRGPPRGPGRGRRHLHFACGA